MQGIVGFVGFVEIMSNMGLRAVAVAHRRTEPRLRPVLHWPVVLASVVLLFARGAASTASAASAVITFSDQPEGEGPMSPTVYTSANGLPTGITATFTNFTAFDGDPDHTNNGDMKLVYGSSNTPPTTITFNTAVIVPSFWITPGFGGSKSATVTGSLGGVDQFTVMNNGSTSSFKQVAAGAGKPIDTLRFDGFFEGELDDLTISTVPEPSGLAALVGAGAVAALHRRRALRRRSARPNEPLAAPVRRTRTATSFLGTVCTGRRSGRHN